MGKNERLLLEDKPLITSLIFEELRRSNIDSIQVICKDGKTMNCSCLLLAALSPLLADILKYQDSQDFVIILPDIDITILKHTLNSALNVDHKHSNLDKQILMLDGIFWEVGYLRKSFIFNEEDLADLSAVSEPEIIDTKDNLNYQIDEAYLDNDVGHFLDDLDFSTTFYTDFQIKEDKIVDEEPVNDLDRNSIIKDESNIMIRDCFIKIERLPKVLNDKNCRKRKIGPCPKQNLKPKKVRKTKQKKEEEDKNSIENLKQKKEEEDQNSIENLKQKNLELEAKGCSERFIIPGIEESVDEDFKAAQEELKFYLEDSGDFEDPRIAWFKCHDLNSDVHLLKNFVRKPRLECPVCMLSFSIAREYDGRHYFQHLRYHKFKTLKCDCSSHIFSKSKKAAHIKMDHWGWTRCNYCPLLLEKNELKFHLVIRHKEKAEPLICPICQTTRKLVKLFKNHMDDHTNINKKLMCKICNIRYRGENHRVHHDQVYHIGELLGCRILTCFFTCQTEEEMNEHVKIKHNKAKSENDHKQAICDICGYASINKRSIEAHKKMKHDSVLIRCPKCPKMFNSMYIKMHMNSVHVEPTVCTICGVKVKKIKDHMKLHMPFDKCKFKCVPCKRGFVDGTKLKNHMMNIHIKERPFKCRYGGCKEDYNDLSNRNHHEKRKHGKLFSNKEITEV